MTILLKTIVEQAKEKYVAGHRKRKAKIDQLESIGDRFV
jgi:hypothetical protein